MGNSNKGAIIAIVVVVALIIVGVVAYFVLAKEPAAAPEVSETVRMYEISEDQFEKEVMKATEKRVIVYFYANWCGPCKTTTPSNALHLENRTPPKLRISWSYGLRDLAHQQE